MDIKELKRRLKKSDVAQIAGLRGACMAALLCVAATVASHGQTFSSLVSFDGSNGGQPNIISLVQGTDGNLYGTTPSTVFQITPEGTFTNLNTLTDGYLSTAGLVQATDMNFYGTTEEGGTHNGGTIFKITSEGKLTTLYNFCSQTNCADGEQPDAGLVQGRDGSLYGTTQGGGANGWNGTIFKITLDGALTTLYSFCSQTNCADGFSPDAALVQARNGNFYGSTINTIFQITPAGVLTTILTFEGSDAITSALVQASDGNFYGGTVSGGPHNVGSLFRITPSGVLTTLYTFCTVFVEGACLDGAEPYGSLIQGSDGNLYGTTYLGGAKSSGTIFKITLDGTLTTLYTFCAQTNCDDGEWPFGGLVQATNGSFYGTTWGGGDYNYGTVFTLTDGLNPFVQAQPSEGNEGTHVWILGQDFSSSSVVKFGGTEASITELAGTTFILATVPTNALTGPVTVTTGTTMLTSPQIFRVLPTITSIPQSGSVGTLVPIAGSGLGQTRSVTFGGVAATTFDVISDTEVRATVPTGAKTGKIAVTTKGGSATSKTIFTVN